MPSNCNPPNQHHEKVWLVYHIPPGHRRLCHHAHAKTPGAVTLLWKAPYLAQFTNLLAQYAGTVGPNFAGHVHVDDFRLLSQLPPQSSPFVIVTPALSPITGQNPTFRTVQFDPHGNVKDFATYFLNNFTHWQLEYDFLQRNGA